LRINQIEIKRLKPSGSLIAFASCCLTGELNLKLSSIAIHSDGVKKWITFPKIRTPNGELFFSYYPLDDLTREIIEAGIIEKHEKEMNENGELMLG